MEKKFEFPIFLGKRLGSSAEHVQHRCIDLPWVPYRSPTGPLGPKPKCSDPPVFSWSPPRGARLVLPEIHWIIISGGGSKVQTYSKPPKR